MYNTKDILKVIGILIHDEAGRNPSVKRIDDHSDDQDLQTKHEVLSSN